MAPHCQSFSSVIQDSPAVHRNQALDVRPRMSVPCGSTVLDIGRLGPNTQVVQANIALAMKPLCAPKAKASLVAPREGGPPRHTRAAAGCHDRCSASFPPAVRRRMHTLRSSYCITCATPARPVCLALVQGYPPATPLLNSGPAVTRSYWTGTSLQ